MNVKNLIALGAMMATIALSSGFVQPTERGMVNQIEADGVESFAEFLSNFEKVSLPYSMSLTDLSSKPNQQKTKVAKKDIGRSHFMRSGSFINSYGRMGPPRLEAIARFYPNRKSVAVIYSSSRFFGEHYKHYLLRVFDLKGKPIDTYDRSISLGEFVFASSMPKEVTTCRVDEAGYLWKSTFENVWKKDIEKNGVRNNKIVSRTLKQTEVYKFKANGSLVVVNVNSKEQVSMD